MGLLTKATRKKWMKMLGYDYTKSGILKMQKDYFKRKQDCDGIYGPNTDKLLRHLHHVKVYAPSFSPEEFRCPCGHCTGYPTWMRVNELKNLIGREEEGRESLLMQARKAVDKEDFEEISRLEILIEEKVEELRNVYLKYKRNIF